MNTLHDSGIKLVITATAVIVALAMAVILSPATRADTLAHYQPASLAKAERALERGNPERALALLNNHRAILKHQRFVARSQALTCEAHFQRGDFQQAEQSCDAAVASASEGTAMARYLNNRGAARLMLGRLDLALEDFAQALQLNPGLEDARRNAALAEVSRY